MTVMRAAMVSLKKTITQVNEKVVPILMLATKMVTNNSWKWVLKILS